MVGGELRLGFWGVRGTIASPGGDRLRYGGNTACLAIPVGEADYVVLDCGTGGRRLGQEIERCRGGSPARIDMLFSHYHLDHTEGLALFAPLYAAGNTIRIHGVPPPGRTLRDTFETLVAPPYFPIPIAESAATVEYSELNGGEIALGELTVSVLAVNHPGGCHAYRIEHGGRKVVYATDHEHGDPSVDAAFERFVAGAEYLIYDAMYLPEEYDRHRGWGHSTWVHGVRLAKAAGVRNLVLFHHEPDRSDDELDALLASARAEHPSTTLAREGESIPL